MQLAADPTLHSLMDLVLEILPQLGIGFLMLIGVLIVVSVVGGIRRRAPTSPPGQAHPGGAEGD